MAWVAFGLTVACGGPESEEAVTLPCGAEGTTTGPCADGDARNPAVDASAPGALYLSDVRELADTLNASGNHADWAEARVRCRGVPPLEQSRRVPERVVPPPGYKLVWSDEFDVDGRPNPANWSYERGFVRNRELQWYQAKNARVRAGFLIIEGCRERVANPNYRPGSKDWRLNRRYANYTSTSMHTRGKVELRYGIFEMRGRIVAKRGLWPAWWSLGVTGEWPSSGEIDMFEYYRGRVHANTAVGTRRRWVAKWDSASVPVSSFGRNWDSKFHVWRMIWTNKQITLKLDGRTLNTTQLDEMLNPDGRSPFRQPHHMLLNLAIGGAAGGDPSGTPFPSRFEVDYVRVFQRR